MFQNLQHIIFDLDGVLINSEHLHARAKKETLSHFGVTQHIDYEKYNGRTDYDFFTAIKAYHPELSAELDELISFNRKTFTSYYDEIKPIEGAEDFLQHALSRGLQLSNVTSATRLSQVQALQLLKVWEQFKIKVNAEDVQKHKPDPEPYLLAIKQLGPIYHFGFVIEDSPSGIASAKSAGLSVVALGTSFPQSQLLAAGADVFVNNYGELKALLNW